MTKKNGKIRFHRAMTLLELVLAMVMVTIIFAAVLPQFAVIRNSWDSKQGSSEALQNGRVLMDHISRNLSKAKKITVVSDSSATNGYIQFVDNNDVNNRYDIASANSYVEYGPIGTLSDLAGPVTSLTFTCYDACDLDTALSPVTDVNIIRAVKVDAAFTNSASLGQAKTFTTWVYLRTNAVGAPTYQAAGTAASGTGTITPTWPTHLAGDIALLFVESCGGQAVTLSTPAGFANVTNSPQATGAGTNGTRITVFWCRATSSSMSSPTVADPGNHVYGRILTFRNVVTTGNPWDVTAGGTKASASTTTTFGAVTTSVINTLIVLAASRDNDSTAAAWSAWTNANLSSLTERLDEGTTQGNGGGVGVATGLKATAGNIGSTTATVTSSVNGNMTIALKGLRP